jgi:hypothetical protein
MSPPAEPDAPGRAHTQMPETASTRAHGCVRTSAHHLVRIGVPRSGAQAVQAEALAAPQAASWGEPSPGCGPPQRAQGDGGRSPVAPGTRSGAGNPGCAEGVSQGPQVRAKRALGVANVRAWRAEGGTPERELSATRRSLGCQRHKVPWRDRSFRQAERSARPEKARPFRTLGLSRWRMRPRQRSLPLYGNVQGQPRTGKRTGQRKPFGAYTAQEEHPDDECKHR